MFEKVYPHIWMALPKDIKDHLVTVFNIPRTGVSEIRDQQLVSDGYSIEDLQVITLPKMIEYIGSEETFPRAWELSCAKAKYELNPPMSLNTVKTEVIEEEKLPTPNTSKNGNSKKEGK